MAKMKQLIHVGEGDNIHYCMVKGHVTAREFNKIFRRYWKSDWIKAAELKKEYWKKEKNYWVKSSEHERTSMPVTVMEW